MNPSHAFPGEATVLGTPYPLPDRYPVTGNEDAEQPLPVTEPPMSPLPGKALYVDIAAVLSGDVEDGPTPTVLTANDGVGIFYRGQVNLVFGDPESGKTWVCLAAAAEALQRDQKVAIIDVDHNGATAIVSRLLDLGAPDEALIDLDRFRYCEPLDMMEICNVVDDLVAWKPAVVTVDSLGEVLPMFGASSNSPDDFTRVHSRVLKPLAMCGSALLIIDHLAKNPDSRAQGSTGTAAKKRAVGGTSVRVTAATQFTPGQGGSAHLTIAKDRHGGLRAHRPVGDKEPLAGTFKLGSDPSREPWVLLAPTDGQRNPEEKADPELVARLAAMDPRPASVTAARKALGCQMAKASRAMAELRKMEAEGLTGNTETGGAVTGNDRCRTCGERLNPAVAAEGQTTHPGCEAT